MKKRVNSTSSLHKAEKSIPGVVHLDLKKQKKQQTHKHHSRCPLPKPLKKESSDKKKLEQIDTIKQLKTPILNDLRHFISKFINSSDRMLRYLQTDDYKSSFKIYHQDRKKLIQYLNSLVVRPVDINQVKAHLNSLKHKPDIQSSYYNQKINNSTKDCIGKEVHEIKVQIQRAIHKKRSKSSLAHLQSHFEKEVSFVKNKIQELEKRTQHSHEQDFSSFMKLCQKLNSMNHTQQILPNNPESSENLGFSQLESIRSQLARQTNKNEHLSVELTKYKTQIQGMKNSLTYIQLLLFKCGQILQENINCSYQNNQFYTIQKEKIELLINTLGETAQYLRTQSVSSSDIIHKLKQQAQSMVLYLSQIRKKSLELLRQKQKALQQLREQQKSNTQRDQSQYQELKFNVHRLNNDISDLIQEIDKKDEQYQCLKTENSSLRDDLRSMQEHIQQTKANYRNICEEIQEINQKLKNSQTLLQKKDEQIFEYNAELESKNVNIISKAQLLRSKQQEINELKTQNSIVQNAKNALYGIFENQKNLLTHQIQSKSRQIDQLQSRIRYLEHQILLFNQLKQRYSTQKEESSERMNILDLKIQTLEKENEQLYKDIHEFQKNQQKIEDENNCIKDLYKHMQEQGNYFRQQIKENHKKIRFYEEKLIELVQLADTTSYDAIIERNEAIILDLSTKLKYYEEKIAQMTLTHPQCSSYFSDVHSKLQYADKHQSMPQIKRKNSDLIKLQQISSQINLVQNLKDESEPKEKRHEDDYYPFLLQNQCRGSPKSSDHSKQNEAANFLNISRNNEFEATGISALSHYDIIVTNQNLDTIDSHKAIYLKSSQPQENCQKIISLELLTQKEILQPRSDYTEKSESIYPQTENNEVYKLAPNLPQIQKKQYLSETPLKVDNVDANQKLADLGQKMIKQGQLDTKMEDKQKDHVLFKNIDKQQEIKAQLRLSGLRQPIHIKQQVKYQTEKKAKRLRSSQKAGNVYIRMKKQTNGISTLSGDKNQRSKSCLQKII